MGLNYAPLQRVFQGFQSGQKIGMAGFSYLEKRLIRIVIIRARFYIAFFNHVFQQPDPVSFIAYAGMAFIAGTAGITGGF
jgi:hypothetical protein